MSEITNRELEILKTIKESDRFPVVRFELKSSKDKSISSIALKNVWITDAEDSMEKVKADAEILESLKEKGLITIDYSLVVSVSKDYEIYYQSKIFKVLCDMCEEGKTKEGYLFDLPSIKKGMVKLTTKGQRLL